tara:strand:- start:519 stop:791 length:273 start_codon:yes stop_codon:yes gene_type:complete
MKIENFNPGILKPTKNLYFFDNCLIEYFKGETFNIFGSADVIFIEGEIDISYITLNIIKDSEGKKISLSKEIEREIKKDLEDLIYLTPVC